MSLDMQMEDDDYEYDEDSSRPRNLKRDDEEEDGDEPPKDELANEKRGYSSRERAMIEAWLRQNRPATSEE